MSYGGGGGSGGGSGGAGGSGELSSAAAPIAGAFRFNTDSSQLEIYDGNQWTGIVGDSPELRTGETRMLFMGGTNGSSVVDVIQFVNVETTGNAVDFGNLLNSKQEGAALGGPLRAFYFGGDTQNTDIEFVTFSSTGNATDFGDPTQASKSGMGCADRTRGVMVLGYQAPSGTSNVINYIQMSTTGNALDFGDMSDSLYAGGGCDSPTRGVFALGSTSNSGYSNAIEYLTISTTGNSSDFGDITRSGVHCIAYSNAVRGVFHSGYQYPSSPNFMNVIDYVTLATLGNAIDFGDSLLGGFGCGGASRTRGVAGGGYYQNAPTGETGGFTNIIDHVEIMTTGNAHDFGDLTNTVRHIKGDSNGHGGL